MKKPWNLPNLPVYSLATYEDGMPNMNICTYVMPVSMHPKKYMIGVFEGTKTLENISNSDTAVLQLLQKDQYRLVQRFGKTSGLVTSKYEYLQKKDLLETWKSKLVLKDVCARVLLKKSYKMNVEGDHELFVFDVISNASYHDDYLDLNVLRAHKLIRI